MIQISKLVFLRFFENIIWACKLLTIDQIKVFIEIYHWSKFHFLNCGETRNMSIINQIFSLILLILLILMQKYDNTERQYEVGDWVIVHYAEESSEDDYPGEVTLVAENEVTVSVNAQIWCVPFSNGLIAKMK